MKEISSGARAMTHDGRTPSQEILALHRALFRRQRQLIDASVVGYPASFKAYEARYRKGVKGYREVVAYPALVAAVRAADVVYVGDYHTLRQAQKSFARLVERSLSSGRRVALALEFVQGKHQDALDRYLAGKLSEASFLSRIEYQAHQIFDVWPNFRPILELARKHHLDVVAIDRIASGSDSLAVRDAYAAERIAAVSSAVDRPLVLVLTGQLHIAPAHLPAVVARALSAKGAPERESLVVYQNCEEIYWKLAARGLDHGTEAVRVRRGEFCLVNTSPTVCQQSYLDWVDGAGGDDAELEEASGAEKAFKEMARLVASFLALGGVEDALDDVEIFSSGDLSFLRVLKARKDFSPRELASLKRQVLARESCYIPRSKMAYLATLSMNHAGEEATHFLRHVVCGDAMDRRRSPVDAFYARIVEEALGFFGSKVVNPRRKCAQERDLVRLLVEAPREERDVVALALVHKRLEKEGRLDDASGLAAMLDSKTFNTVTHLLGYLVGEQLYYAMLAGKISKRELRAIFLEKLAADGEAMALYAGLLRRVGKVRVPERE